MNETDAIDAAISPLYKERELLHILTDSKAGVIVCWDRLIQLVEPARNKRELDQKAKQCSNVLSTLSTLPSILKGLVISDTHRLIFGLNS